MLRNELVLTLAICVAASTSCAHKVSSAARPPSLPTAARPVETEVAEALRLPTELHRVGDASLYPDQSRTPGYPNPDINQANISQNICNPRWSTSSIRPPSSCTTNLKRQQMRDWRLSGAAGNYEELGDLYLEEQDFTRARECYDKAIRSRADMPDAFYRRGIAKIQLGDFAGAVPDIEHVVSRDPKYDSSRAAGLLAHAYANTGQAAKAEALFQQVTERSTLSENYYNYASFLASQGRKAEAREWTQRILAKKPTMPGYLRRRERPWFRKANGLLTRLAA